MLFPSLGLWRDISRREIKHSVESGVSGTIIMILTDLFTEEEVVQVRAAYSPKNGWNIISGTDFSSLFFGMLSRNNVAYQYFQKEFQGKRIIELGAGRPGLARGYNAPAFAELGAREYIVVDPMLSPKDIVSFPTRKQSIPTELVSQDGLSYLLQQKEESSVIFSSAMFLTDAIFNLGLSLVLGMKYSLHLFRQIGRVTPSGGITVHL